VQQRIEAERESAELDELERNFETEAKNRIEQVYAEETARLEEALEAQKEKLSLKAIQDKERAEAKAKNSWYYSTARMPDIDIFYVAQRKFGRCKSDIACFMDENQIQQIQHYMSVLEEFVQGYKRFLSSLPEYPTQLPVSAASEHSCPEAVKFLELYTKPQGSPRADEIMEKISSARYMSDASGITRMLANTKDGLSDAARQFLRTQLNLRRNKYDVVYEELCKSADELLKQGSANIKAHFEGEVARTAIELKANIAAKKARLAETMKNTAEGVVNDARLEKELAALESKAEGFAEVSAGIEALLAR
jgi:hypothetical protein